MAVIKFFFTALALALLIASCARMASPPGGPEDKEPPTVVTTNPAHNALLTPLDTDVTLEFSEPVNRPSVEAALYLSPEPGRRLRYRWLGKRLTLDFLDPLLENRTFVVTVGAQAKDLQGNPLEESYTLAFSTGDHIDRGKISGVTELPDGTKSVAITAYVLTDSLPDPMRDYPDYRIQTTPEGQFELGYLATGKYRLFALNDRNFDGMWSPANEWVGTATQDVLVDESSDPRVSFAPSLHDTTSTAILRTRQIDERTVSVRFNRNTVPTEVEISDKQNIQHALYFTNDTSSTGSWLVHLDEPLTRDSATLVAEIEDLKLTSIFSVHSRPDTSHPQVFQTFPANRSMNRLVTNEVSVIFNEPIVFASSSDSLAIALRVDTLDVEIHAEQSDPASITITSVDGFQTGVKYSLVIPSAFIADRAGNTWNDSLWSLTWYNYPDDSLGTIEGVVRSPEIGPWLVELYRVKTTEPEQAIFTNNNFKFEGYPEGEYRIRVIRDVNRNQKFDRGNIAPFEFSEPFQWHPDTISVRPRWTGEVEFLWTTVTQY